MSKRAVLSVVISSVLVFMLASVSPGLASVFYDYTVIGKTGDAPNPGDTAASGTLTFLGGGVSVNDLGQVAFQGQLSNGTNGLFSGDGLLPSVRAIANGTFAFSPTVQINNQSLVVGREPLSGGNSAIRAWGGLGSSFRTLATGSVTIPANFSGFYPFPSINNINALEILGSAGGNGNGTCDPGESCVPQVAMGAFALITDPIPLNDTLATLRTASGSTANRLYNTLPLASPLLPQVADTGDVVLRANINATNSEIRVYDYALTSFQTIATAPAEFSTLGRAPGISEDGQIVVFFGDLKVDGANTINTRQGGALDPNCPFRPVPLVGPISFPILPILKPGPGIFASVKTTTKGRVLLRIAGTAQTPTQLDPGETFQDNGPDPNHPDGCWQTSEPITELAHSYTALEADARVAVNSTQRDELLDKNMNGWSDLGQRGVTIAYMATDETNRRLLTNRLNFYGLSLSPTFDSSNPGYISVSQATVVATVGDDVGNGICAVRGNQRCLDVAVLSGKVTSLDWNDPLNNWDRGDVVFKMGLDSGTQAVIRASPLQVVYLNFSPASSFRLSPSLRSLLGEVSTPSASSCPGAGCPWGGNFDSVITSAGRSDLNSGIIMANVVTKVQERFDDMDRALSNPHPSLPLPPLVSSACPATTGGAIPLRARVKVFGSNSTLVPNEGLVTSVYIGDGPHGDASPCDPLDCAPLTGGIAQIDLFNQNDLSDLLAVPSSTSSVPNLFTEPSALVFADNIFRIKEFSGGKFLARFSSTSNPNSPGTPISLTAGTSVPGYITQDQVGNALTRVIAHELGHTFGLRHVRDDCNLLIMNSPTSTDEARYEQKFGNQSIEREESDGIGIVLTDSQNSSKRLAFGAGSSREPLLFQREAPSFITLEESKRVGFEMVALGALGSVVVAKAVLGIVGANGEDESPAFIDLGSGPLGSLLNRNMPIRNNDKVFLVASTTGAAIDIFSARPSEVNPATIQLDNALLLLTESRIRSAPINPVAPPSVPLVNVYQRTATGVAQIGQAGSSSMVAVVVPNVVGLSQSAAVTALASNGLSLGSVTVAVSSSAVGTVISQNPAAGTPVASGSKINLVLSSGPPALSGDLDGDSDIDKNDIGIILAAKGTAATGPNDPRDVDKDGQITILDARKLATMCTRPNCAP